MTVPAALELDALIRYEMSKLGLWHAICKKSPQLALFEEVYGDSPDSGAEWVSYSTSDTLGEPVRLLERRTNAHKWCRTVLGRMGLTAMSDPGLAPSSPPPPVDEDGSAPTSPREREVSVSNAPMGKSTDGRRISARETAADGRTFDSSRVEFMDVDRPRPHDQETMRGRGQKEQQ